MERPIRKEQRILRIALGGLENRSKRITTRNMVIHILETGIEDWQDLQS
jgi:hypothetical protein